MTWLLNYLHFKKKNIFFFKQNDNSIAESLLATTKLEPRLKGAFDKLAFQNMLNSVVMIHNLLISAATLIERNVSYSRTKPELLRVRQARREFIMTTTQLFYTLALSVRTKVRSA